MIQVNEFFFPSSGGQNRIYCREYMPEGEPRGIVQLSHGIAEHILRYDGFARYLAEHGYIVAANDHLGHGHSIEDREELGWLGDGQGWEHVLADMHTFHRTIRSRHPGLPYFLLGHSMGSFLVRCYVIRFREPLDGIILTGTGHQGRALTEGAALLTREECRRKGSRYRSRLLLKQFSGRNNAGIDGVRTVVDWISRDPETVDLYLSDPLCGYVPTAGLFRDMLGGIAYMTKQKNIEHMNRDLPVYFLSGDRDPVGEMGKGVMRAYKAFLSAGMRDVTMKLYAGARHEILFETNRDEVYGDILAWLDVKCGR